MSPVAGKSDKSNYKEFCISSCIYPRYLFFNKEYIALDLITLLAIAIALAVIESWHKRLFQQPHAHRWFGSIKDVRFGNR
jgi:hypothetical protein